MIFGIGTDIVRVARMQQSLEKHGERFAKRILTEHELSVRGVHVVVGKSLGGPVEVVLVHVAQGDDVLARYTLDVSPSPVARAHTANIELLVRGFGLGGGKLAPHAA